MHFHQKQSRFIKPTTPLLPLPVRSLEVEKWDGEEAQAASKHLESESSPPPPTFKCTQTQKEQPSLPSPPVYCTTDFTSGGSPPSLQAAATNIGDGTSASKKVHGEEKRKNEWRQATATKTGPPPSLLPFLPLTGFCANRERDFLGVHKTPSFLSSPVAIPYPRPRLRRFLVPR